MYEYDRFSRCDNHSPLKKQEVFGQMLGQYFWRDVKSYFSNFISSGWLAILVWCALGLLVHWLDYRRHKVCRFWPGVAAFGVYLISFAVLLFWYNMRSYYYSMRCGAYALGFALGWFLMELVLRLSRKNNASDRRPKDNAIE